MQSVNPVTLAPPEKGIYSQISIAPTGRLAFIAGQVARDADGKMVGIGDHRTQALQCFRNIAAAIAAVGAQPSQLVRMSFSVVAHDKATVGIIFDAGLEIFGDDFPACASTYRAVVALGMPDWLIEIDGIISLPD
ncbi:MAG: hypothetical protein RL268_22 [Pseudomonadota bacterium]